MNPATSLDTPPIARLAGRGVMLLTLGICAIGLDWGLPNARSWAPDALEPALVLRGLGLGWGEDWWSRPRYPPFHFVVLAAAVSPYLLYLRLFEPEGWTIVASFLSGDPGVTLDELINDPGLVPVATQLILISRAVSVLAAVGTVALMMSIGRRLFGPWPGVIAGLLIAGYYPFVYHGHVENTDMPQLFWAALSFAALTKALLEPGRGWRPWVVSAVAAACAIATKDGAAGLFLAVPLILMAVFGAKRFWRRREPWLWLGVSLAAFAVTTLLVFRPTLYPRHVAFLFGYQFDNMREYAQAGGGQSAGGIGPPLRLLIESLTLPGSIALGVGLLGSLAIWPRRSALVLLPALTYFMVIVLGAGWVYVRFLLPVALVLLLLASAGLTRFVGAAPTRLRRSLRLAIVAGMLAPWWLLGPRLDGLLLDDPRDQIAERLASDPPRRGVLYLTVHSWSPAFLGIDYPVRYELLGNPELTEILRQDRFDRLVFQRLPSPLSDKPLAMPAVGQRLAGWEIVELMAPDSDHPALKHIALQPTIVIGRRP